MAFTPNSRVYLLDTPLDNNYKNQLRFATPSAQYNYFYSKRKHTYDGVTYQRKDNAMLIDAHIDDLYDVNYVMYQNTHFSDRWMYAFITKMEYENERVTRVTIETDVYQTWLFDCTLKPSFVVREHVHDDTIGKHLADEQLEIGEYIMQNYQAVNKMGVSWNILATSDNAPLGNTDMIGNIYGNVVTGLTYFPFPNTSAGIEWLKSVIALYDTAGKSDAIVMLFTVPQLVVQGIIGHSAGQPISTGEPCGYDDFTINKQLDTIDGYTPKNNKMHTYPYKMLYVSNNSGQSATYRYEDFKNDQDPTKMQFSVFGSVMPNPMIMFAPVDYKGDGIKYEYGLTLTGFPMGSWTSDAYTAWFAQNGASVGVALAGSAIALIGGAVTGNAVAIGGGVYGIASQLAQIQKASMQPDQAKGQVGSGSLHYGSDTLDFYYSHMTIKAEFAKRVDDFLTMFGYKVNTLKVPETHSRLNWNFIQTIDVNVIGEIPDEDMHKVKAMYNNGITLWHNPSTFLDYSQANTII